ncbi:protein phosphatase 2C domain-containing protein [Planctomycetes bacterium TBK1r]|uniref:PPM-type phosphatase domain-containing protein n=1 Tax=Stieleria magnilauensis TaxID=2527963 RepID=A0ABX5XWS7_9BACT|nr:hypothetical protein TBK1r_43850 [Planctomycetes bacterium TBK1r]
MNELEFEIIDASRRTIAQFGSVFETSGSFSTDQHSISFHTSIGPPQVGKTVNEDAILGFRSEDNSSIHWACAVADGVGSSTYPEVGSRSATWAALAYLVEHQKHRSARTQGIDAIHFAQAAILKLAATLKADLTDLKFKPSYLPTPAYRRVVNRQSCFQTTLCLVWCDGQSIFLASVGDSGALQSSANKGLSKLFFPDVTHPQVNALCPSLSTISIDDWQEISARQTSLAVFTDGVAKSLVDRHGDRIFKELEFDALFSSGSAERSLHDLELATPEDAADNMSLLLVRPS